MGSNKRTFAYIESYLDWLVNESDHGACAVLSRNDSLDLEYKRGAVYALMLIMETALGGKTPALRNYMYRQAKAYADGMDERSEVVARFRTDFPAAVGGNIVPFKLKSKGLN